MSDDAGCNKPDCRFFEYAERKAGTVGRRNVIVGDYFATDIRGALAAGWDAIWCNPKGEALPEDLAEAVFVADSLGAMPLL